MTPYCLCLLDLILRGVSPRTAPNGQPDLAKGGNRPFREILGGLARNLLAPYGDRAIAETRTPCFFRGYRVAVSKNP